MKSWFLLLLLFLAACSRDPATENDTQPPAITLASPADGQTFTAGQSIPITGSITDDNYIAEVHIHVSNNTTGALLMDVHLYPAGKTGSFSQSLTATSGTSYKIQVIARDRNLNEARSTVLVSGN